MARYAKSIALSLLNKKRSAVAPLNARLNIYGVIIPQNHLIKLKSISENDKIVRTFINDYKVSKLRKELSKAIKWHPSTSSANLAKAGHSDNK